LRELKCPEIDIQDNEGGGEQRQLPVTSLQWCTSY
jgi:hypothetical protein